MSDPVLVARGVGHAFGDGPRILQDVDLSVRPGECVGLVGASGCGKTTLLRILCGLLAPESGQVDVGGRSVRRTASGVVLVSQHYAETLLPWKRALDNVLLGLPGTPEERERAAALLARMGLGADAARFPWELSGGMQQRVALARALVRRPSVLLLDEPFSAVDEKMRGALYALIDALHRDAGCGLVLVSHNLDEVVRLAHRVVVLRGQPSRAEELPAGAREAVDLRQSLA